METADLAAGNVDVDIADIGFGVAGVFIDTTNLRVGIVNSETAAEETVDGATRHVKRYIVNVRLNAEALMGFLGTRPDSNTTAHQADRFTAGDVDENILINIGRSKNVFARERVTGTNRETAGNEGNVVTAVDLDADILHGSVSLGRMFAIIATHAVIAKGNATAENANGSAVVIVNGRGKFDDLVNLGLATGGTQILDGTDKTALPGAVKRLIRLCFVAAEKDRDIVSLGRTDCRRSRMVVLIGRCNAAAHKAERRHAGADLDGDVVRFGQSRARFRLDGLCEFRRGYLQLFGDLLAQFVDGLEGIVLRMKLPVEKIHHRAAVNGKGHAAAHDAGCETILKIDDSGALDLGHGVATGHADRKTAAGNAGSKSVDGAMGFVTLGVVEGEVRVARHGGIGSAVKNSNGRTAGESPGDTSRTLDINRRVTIDNCFGIFGSSLYQATQKFKTFTNVDGRASTNGPDDIA